MATEKKSKETSGLKKTKEGSAHKKKEYKVSARLQEGKKVLYGIVFNLLDSRYKDLFATCGGNRATVYRCLEDGSVSGLHTYVDENVPPFPTLTFSSIHHGFIIIIIASHAPRREF
eukprot:jgi/Mesen1/3840/ME000207S02848